MSEAERPEDPGPPAGYGASRQELEQLRLPRDESGAIAGSRRRRWPVLLAGLVLILAGGGVAVWRSFGRPLMVETARAAPLGERVGERVPVLSGSGYLVPAQPFIAVGSRVAGRIDRYLVEEGDRVRAGQPMVELDDTPFRAAADQARASLVSARAQRQLAESELRRANELRSAGVLSEDAFQRSESEARVARARVAELEAVLDRSRSDLEDAVIRAPTDGVVLETYKQPGEIAVPGGFSGSGDLLRLANLSELRAQLDVNESDLPRVFRDQEAEIVPDAFPESRYEGRVVKLSPQIDRQKGTREVEVRVLEPDEKLLPDMSVRVIFFERFAAPSSGGGSVVVPRGALRRDANGGSFVWIARDGRAAKLPIEIGETLGDQVVVREGLAGGESLIVGEPPEQEGEPVAGSPAADEESSGS